MFTLVLTCPQAPVTILSFLKEPCLQGTHDDELYKTMPFKWGYFSCNSQRDSHELFSKSDPFQLELQLQLSCQPFSFFFPILFLAQAIPHPHYQLVAMLARDIFDYPASVSIKRHEKWMNLRSGRKIQSICNSFNLLYNLKGTIEFRG